MSLSLTSLDDAYITEQPAAQPSFQAQAQAPPTFQAPALPDHQKRGRPVSLRPEPECNAVAASKTTGKKGVGSESFTDKLWSRRRDMVKVVIMVLMVTVALAAHSVLSEFLAEYLASAYLSPGMERVAKLCYPASLMAAIWCLKITHKP
jgi:hypothetical protein